eukprot:TRINITY_DN24280_c0_g1_i1.p1 TRINITY_DN24280_c0_g1~~TRINITY_DN24280_c0_g1_i1.p1  ORF type:complete len:246 (-),score=77.20 TRINITY_DN24280_c0_g1_i1:251-988(-)
MTTGTKLVKSNLSEVNLSGCNLSGFDLTGTKLCRAILTGANLSAANLSGSDLTGVVVMDSQVLTGDLQGKLLAMLPPMHTFRPQFKFKKVLTSATSGTSASAFDSAMKGVGPFVIAIRNSSNYVFGAYVADVFGVPGYWIQGSRETFLFSFGNTTTTTNPPPLPIKLLHNGNSCGIHITSCGLHLGDRSSAEDLKAFCGGGTCGTPKTYTIAAAGYAQVAPNESTLAGSSNWTPTLMEVFALTQP